MTAVHSRVWRSARAAALGIFGGVFAVPLLAALVLAVREGSQPAAWAAMVADPQVWPAWQASVRIALLSTLGSLGLAMALATGLHGSRLWRWLDAALAPMLAVPHAAFAIGCALLVMPSGLVARLFAAGLGWTQPPAWPTVHDQAGFAMAGVLVLKELPFLLWNLVALLARPEIAQQLQRQRLQALTFGWRSAALWWRVWWPALLPRLAWPLLAVLAYSLSVVDVALVIGPLSPPPMAVLAWQSLLDGDAAAQAVGAAQVIVLTLTLAGLALLGAGAMSGWRRLALRWATGGPDGAATARARGFGSVTVLLVVIAVFAAALALLAFAAGAGPWPFPALAPASWGAAGWWQTASPTTLGLSAALAGAASVLALGLAVAWLECTPERIDATLAPLLLAPLAVPPLLLLIGLYQGALVLRLDGSLWGLLWVHVIVVLPYALIVLAPAWRGFDARYETTALTLGRGRLAFWWHAKWPMLRAPIGAALSVGFAVALAQYLPTLFIGAGRFATVTTEAVTLSSGGQRQMAAAYALWQAVLPLLAFVLAAWARRRAA